MIDSEEHRRINSRLQQLEQDQPGAVARMLKYYQEMDAAFVPLRGKDSIASTAANILYKSAKDRYPKISGESLEERLRAAVQMMEPPCSILLTLADQIAQGGKSPLEELDHLLECCSGPQSPAGMN